MSNIEISDKNIVSLLLALKNTPLRDEEKKQISTIGWLLSLRKTNEEKNSSRKLAEQNLSTLLNGNSDLYRLFENYQKRLEKIQGDTLRGSIPERNDIRKIRPDLFPEPEIVERGVLATLTDEKSYEIENVALDIFTSPDLQEAIRSVNLKKLEQLIST
jgi:hypothetical protein